MSKKTYLLLALLCVGVVLSMVPASAALPREDVKTWNIGSSNPGWALDDGWAYGKPQGLGGIDGAGKDPTAIQAVGNVLGTNLAGNYAADSAVYATSNDLDLSANVGVQLSFRAWLAVQDNLHDQATVEVSNDGGDSWTEVWANSPDSDTLDTTFNTELVDISSVADGQTIQIRFGLVSDGDIEYGGWNVTNVTVSANADAIANDWLMGATDDITGDWTLDTGWTVGSAVEGSSGQTIDSALVGADPTENADGDAGGLVLGYNIGANYERGMGRKFATTPDLDFSSETSVKLAYARWLAVEDAAADHASVQINIDPDLAEVFADDFSGDLTDYTFSGTGLPLPEISGGALQINGKMAVSRVIDTSEYYEIVVTADMGATWDTGSTGTFKLQWRKRATDSWTDLATITSAADVDLTTFGPFAIPVDTGGEDNANFEIRFVLNGLQTDAAEVDNILVEGVNWAYLWQNPVGENVFDDAWVDESFDLSSTVDGEAAVRLRWVMGPTNDKTPVPPQPDHEFGGWSVDNIELTYGTFAWLPEDMSLPASLEWESEGDATFTDKNYGTGYWDDSFVFELIDAASLPANVTSRWGATDTAVDGEVAAGETYDFGFTLTAPPITSIMYAEDTTPTAIADADLSALDINGMLTRDDVAVEAYDNLSGDNPIQTDNIVVSRFPDDQPDTDGFWARYYIEELAGRVPFVVQGFPGTPGPTYRPGVEIDRAAMSVYIQRAMGLALRPYEGIFNDVPGPDDPEGRTEHWAWPQIESLQRADVVQGIPPTYMNYAPADLVTRDAMAKFIANGMGLSTPDPSEAPFDDVPLLLPGTTTINPFAAFIAAVKNANVVQGYEDITEPLGVTYRPKVVVGRDQLAVFVWRGFMRDSGAAVVLAGPGITDADLSDSTIESYPGWQSVSEADSWDAENSMYVQWDALRLKSDLVFTPSSQMDVKFELRKPAEDAAPAARTWNFPLTAAAINALVAARVVTGDPYTSMFMLIPAGTPTPSAALLDDYHGDFTFVVSIHTPTGTGVGAAWSEVVRQPSYKSYGRTYFDNFDSGIPGAWDLTGDPADPLAAVATGSDLEGMAAKFVQSGSMEQNIDLTGWDSLIVSAKVLAAFLSADDTFTIEYSVDGGTTWTEGYSLSDVDNTEALDNDEAEAESVEFELPASANDNSNFFVRISLNGGSLDSIVYLDDFQIKGL